MYLVLMWIRIIKHMLLWILRKGQTLVSINLQTIIDHKFLIFPWETESQNSSTGNHKIKRGIELISWILPHSVRNSDKICSKILLIVTQMFIRTRSLIQKKVHLYIYCLIQTNEPMKAKQQLLFMFCLWSNHNRKTNKNSML